MIFSFFKKRKLKQESATVKNTAAKEVSINEIDHAETLFLKLSHVSAAQEEKKLCIRIATLCNEGKIELNDIKQNISQIERLLQISLLIDNSDALLTLCPTVNEDFFLQFSQEGFTAKSRKQSFDQLTSIESFKKLMTLAKGKDKTIFRAAQEKVAIQLEAQQADDQIKKEVTHNLDQINNLAASTYAPQYEAKLGLIIKTWLQNIDNADSRYHPSVSQLSQFEHSKLTCDNTITTQNKIENPTKAETKVETKAVSEQAAVIDVVEEPLILDNEKEALLIKQCSDACIDLLDNQNDEAFARLDNLFVEAFKETLSASAMNQLTRLQKFAQAEQTLTRLISQWIEQNINESQASDELDHWFKALPSEIKQSNHDSIVKAQSAIDERKKAFQEKQTEQKEAIDELFSLFRRGFSAINSGQVRRSAGINKGIEDQLEKIDLDKAPNMLNKKLEEFNEKLAKLQDWHEYATEPKKLELIIKMEKLINCGINPELLANKVKDLQSQWKQLSQGSSNKHQGLWEQFNEHAQKAYEPCKSFFDELGQLRQTNLEQRKKMVSELQSYIENINWLTADFKQVIILLRTAKEQWQTFSPVERSASQSVQHDFNTCIKMIQKQLDSEFADNQEIKESLISKAQAALLIEHARDSVEEIKKLQQQWKNVGLVERKTEQKLWESFRKHCDAVFEKRNIQSKEFKQQINDNLKTANDICTKLEDLIKTQPLDLTAAEELQEQFKQVGMLPKQSIEVTQNRFKTANELIITVHHDSRIAKQEEKWINLESLAKQVEACEEAWLNESTYEHLLDQLKLDNQSIKTLPFDIIAFESRLDRVLENHITEIDHCESTLNEICVRTEILANIDSPETQQALRMHLQVERLKNDFGQTENVREQLDVLTRQWFALGPIAEEVRAPLNVRFKLCRDAIID
ncbi:MAG: DUF349 domain-containing protein [Saccharospirillaceae bacterium]|nr:DUF349 domain-containing protein [Pseudomonadales bacterium]NRB79317.1 DUF349 domain-containing protein [Saccharospirillaceae bacterium]